MLGLDYNTIVENEMMDIPFSYYYVDEKHPCYHAPLHWHHSFEIVRVLQGQLNMFLDNKPVLFPANSIVLINQNVIHGFSPKNCVYEIIDFDAKKIMIQNSLCRDSVGIFANKHVRITPTLLTVDTPLYHAVSRLFHVSAEQQHKEEILILGVLFEVIGMIHADHYYTDTNSVSSNAKNAEQFKPVLEYIEKNYMSAVTLDELSHVSGMSVSYFSKTFRDTFGQSPFEYLNSYRVERASLLLLESELPITEVAYRSGFNDSAYFAKVFYKYKKITPKKYRGTSGIIHG